MVFILVGDHALAIVNGDYLFGPLTTIDAGGGAGMAEGGKSVGLLPGDSLATAQLITGLRHERAAHAIEEVGEKIILHILGEFFPGLWWPSEPVGITHVAQDVGGLAEVLHSSGDHGICFAELYHLGAGDYRLNPTATDS